MASIRLTACGITHPTIALIPQYNIVRFLELTNTFRSDAKATTEDWNRCRCDFTFALRACANTRYRIVAETDATLRPSTYKPNVIDGTASLLQVRRP